MSGHYSGSLGPRWLNPEYADEYEPREVPVVNHPDINGKPADHLPAGWEDDDGCPND